MRHAALLLTLILLAGLDHDAAARPGPDTALQASVRPAFFESVTVRTKPSCPPTFDLVLARTAAAGTIWTLDGIARPDADGRIVVRVTERVRPYVCGVPGRHELTVPLQSLRKGLYVVDLHLRRDEGRYERVHAFVLDAR